MIIDHCTYAARPGARLPRLYERQGLPVQMKYLGHLVGYFTTEVGNVNEIVHIWAYQDLADRTKRRGCGPRMAVLLAEKPRIPEDDEQQDIGANFLLTHEVRGKHVDDTPAPQRRAGPDRPAAHPWRRHQLRRAG